MEFVKKDLFEMKAKELGLKRVNSDYWCLPECDLMFSYNEWGYINANGIVPIDLFIELYNRFKNIGSKTIFNIQMLRLLAPVPNASELIKYASIDYSLVMSEMGQKDRKFEADVMEIRKHQLAKALIEAYDNCYSEVYYIYSLEAFELFIEEVQAYYSRKKEQDKSPVYQLQG